MSHPLARVYFVTRHPCRVGGSLVWGVPPVFPLPIVYGHRRPVFLKLLLGGYFRNLSDEKRCAPRNAIFAWNAWCSRPGGRTGQESSCFTALRAVVVVFLLTGAGRKLAQGLADLFLRGFILMSGFISWCDFNVVFIFRVLAWRWGFFPFGDARATLWPPGRAHLPN